MVFEERGKIERKRRRGGDEGTKRRRKGVKVSEKPPLGGRG